MFAIFICRLYLATSCWTIRINAKLNKKFRLFMLHKTPTGADLMLLPFLTLIEFVRDVIRVVTLRVRLTANLSVGHTILRLLISGYLLLTWIFTVIMFVFELIVAVVQSFVFSLLSSVYISEV